MGDRITLSSPAIAEVLPHGSGFRFVDWARVDHENESVEAEFYTDQELPFFRDHFPDGPVMPGVLILEAMAQAGAIGVLLKPGNEGKIPMFRGAEEVSWEYPVVPGKKLRFAVKFLGGERAYGEAFIGEKRVCSATISFKLVPQKVYGRLLEGAQAA